jgi:flagellar export protein FliJ
MQAVAQHADQKEQDAVRLFVEAQRVVAAAEQQLQQLFGYRNEYAQKLLSTGYSGLSSRRLRDHQSFVATIGQTIEQLHIDIENKKHQCERQKQAWLKCRTRCHALNSVVEKYRQEEFRQMEKHEQNEQDEHAARVTRYGSVSRKS